ncbi:amidase [Streptomyces sannanensis]
MKTAEETAEKTVTAALERIERLDTELCAFIEVWPEEALARAREVDRRVKAGERLPLAGMPIAVKGPTGIPSFAARQLVRAGCVPVGSTAVPGPEREWQTWGRGAHGRTVNPYRRDRTPGGSSAGSAVAVAASMVPLATGSDGAGSVRIPAAWCGVLGLKTTNGLLPSPDRTGLASAGVLARGATEAAAYLRCVLGLRAPVVPLPLTATWSLSLGFADCAPEVAAVARAAAERWSAAGIVRLTDRPLILLDPRRAWYAIRGGAPDAAAPLRAENNRRLDALFAATPLLLTPATPNRPHGHDGPGERYSTALTWAFNVSGHPAMSLPAGFTPDGCPVGLQAVAPHGAEHLLLRLAQAVEAAGRSASFPAEAE